MRVSRARALMTVVVSLAPARATGAARFDEYFNIWQAVFASVQDDTLAARYRDGTATMSEMLAYNKATGWTPSGHPLTDDGERIAKGYAAVYAQLKEDNRG